MAVGREAQLQGYRHSQAQLGNESESEGVRDHANVPPLTSCATRDEIANRAAAYGFATVFASTNLIECRMTRPRPFEERSSGRLISLSFVSAMRDASTPPFCVGCRIPASFTT